MKTKVILLLAALTVIALQGCATGNTAQGAIASAAKSAQAEKTATEQRIVDWQNRALGEIAAPVWLLPAARGDWSAFKDTFRDIAQDKILKLGVAQDAKRNKAMTIADVHTPRESQTS